MRETVSQRLSRFGIELPRPWVCASGVQAWRRSGDLLLLGGGPSRDAAGRLQGMLGRDVRVEDGQEAARAAALELLAQASSALDGDLDRVESCLRLGVFINAAPEFYEHEAVADGASELFIEVFGEIGRHSRSAVGVAVPAPGAAVQVEAILRVS